MTTLALAAAFIGGQLSHQFFVDRPATSRAHLQVATIKSQVEDLRKTVQAAQQDANAARQDAEAARNDVAKARQAAIEAQAETAKARAATKVATTEVEALRSSLEITSKELADSKERIGYLERDNTNLKAQVAVKAGPSKTPTQTADGSYQLQDDSGVNWSNTDPGWLVDWVTAVDSRLKRGSLPVAQPQMPVAPVMPIQQYYGSSCTTGSCPQYGFGGGWR